MATKKAARTKAGRPVEPGKHDHCMGRQAASYLTNVNALEPEDRAAIQKELKRIDENTAANNAG